ncbi:enoyl-CoA hydratase-related protein [Virgibacillus saliphilus]|uniref:enoyl-CoA hydratase-related protein n=1 Tax=Virgibacillus saliphilus TaxID=2831674 RepID=UPI0021078319|nr:enoyl-CoA hydratase-related protein [Virgibacillus sp. NKC19-3]
MKSVNEKDVYLEINESVANIVFNRPEKRNAINYDMWRAIPHLIDQCEKNSDVKVILFSSNHEAAFSAGADISEFNDLRSTVEGAKKYTELTLKAEKAIMEVRKPTIAMVSGYCVGGGCEIALACDFRFSDENGMFGITPAKLGIVYSTPGTKNLVDLVGPSKTKDILYTGRLLEAKEALEIGLIDRIYPKKTIRTEVLKYANVICNNARISIEGSKQVVRNVLRGADEDSQDIMDLMNQSFVSNEYKEGVTAFLEKRKPSFK